MNEQPTTPETLSEYIPSPTDAMTEAVGRLNVALRILGDHTCTPRETSDDLGGWDVATITEMLEGITTLLTKSAKRHGKAPRPSTAPETV